MRDTTASVAVPIDTQNEMNTFCAGQAVRADGRLMVVGGTVVGTTGETRVPMFDSWTYKNSTHGWTVSNIDTVKYGRWYASVTPLGSGKMLATSGFDFLNAMMFGGVKTGGGDSLMNDFRPLNLRRWLRWEDDRPTLTGRPEPRHGHSAIFNVATGRTVLFGGVRKNSAGTQDSLLNEVRQMFVENVDSGQNWKWENLTINGDGSNGSPIPRHRHTAQIVDNVMVVYGGLGKGSSGQDSVLSDVWRLILNPNNTHQWKKDDPGPGPNARYGHTAVIDGDEDGGLLPSMVVYGGRREPNSTFASDTVWKLTLDRVDQAKPGQWQAIAWGGPGKREGHVAVMDTIDRHTSPDSHRVVVFGGEKDGAGLTNDVWVLCRPEPGTTWTWHALEVDGTPPAARKRSQAIYDAEWQRLLVFGGDTSLNTAGGEVADIWSVPLDSGNPSWEAHRHDNAPVARQGGAMIFDIRAVSAKIPELFLAAALPGNDWDPLDGAAKRLDNYPLTFQIKNGNVFYAGNSSLSKNDSSYVLNTGTEAWSNAKTSGFYGGSAALTYTAAGAESVLKVGAPDHYKQTLMTKATKTATVDSATGSTTWNAWDDLPTNRRLHNLTIVPDGRVLITAGWSADPTVGNPNPVYALTPHFYESGHWGTGMANDPVSRSYHSTALLLPDARILAAGGPPTDATLTATVFWPPYLFKNGTQEATRPTITSYPTSAQHYGEPFYVDLNLGDGAPLDSILILSLIRPGAVTHSFDMNQRYVALPFSREHGLLRARLTGNPNQLPPGDYLLFAVRTGVGGVPSVGKWLRIESENDVTPPSTAALSITDLSETSLNLRWTAPGDNGTSGVATEYELRRRANTPITESNFSTNTLISTASPKPAGGQEQVSETSLDECTYYWYGLRTRDEQSGGWSSLSIISLLTLGCEGGGGGGGELPPSARPVETSPVALNEVLRLGPLEGGVAAVSLAHGGLSAIRLDSVRVVGVARGDDSLAVLANGEVSVGVRRTPVRIDGPDGEISAAALRSGHHAAAGESLVVEFPPADAGVSPPALVIEIESGSEAAVGGVRVLEPAGSGTWYARASALPGPGHDQVVVKDVVSDRVCLVFRGAYTVRSIARVAPAETPAAVQELGLVRADHARLGTIANVEGIVLEPGERIDLRFAVAEGARTPQDAFLRFRASSATASPAGARRPSRNGLPTAFALGQNQPNPFGEGTVIRFAMPVRSPVTIEVFDVNGRRVKTLAQGERPAGFHTLSWDARDGAGQRVAAGIYLYRMSAGTFRASRKLAVLP